MIEKQPCGNTGRVLVTFRISHYIWADHFAVMGAFNGPHQEVLPLVQSALDPDWHITVALDSGRCYQFVYLCDDDEWNSDNSADDYIVDSDGRVYGIVDPSMGWFLPIVGEVTMETLTHSTWSISGVRYEQELARPQDPVPPRLPAAVDPVRHAVLATDGRVALWV